MQSSKIVEAAHRAIRERPEIFEALLEYERTKKLPKLSYRRHVDFTIDSRTLKEFRRYCEQNNLNMSRVIESCMKEKMKKSLVL